MAELDAATNEGVDDAKGETDLERRQRHMLAARLKLSREHAGLSQQVVASHTGIPRSAISDIERGARRVDSIELKKFALVYGQTLEYLLSEDGDPEDESSLGLLTRAHAGLADNDREKLVAFAQFLRHEAGNGAEDGGRTR